MVPDERHAREEIDRLLGLANWSVQDLKAANIHALRGVAISSHYGLARPVLNSNAFSPIDASEYLSLSRAKEFLLEVLAFEENFGVLLGNCLDLEKAFNDLATEYIVRQDYGHHHAGEMVNSYVFADFAGLVQIRAVALRT